MGLHDHTQENDPRSPLALPLDTLLHGYLRLGKILGIGGFGVTYLALDERLQTTVAIKEYLPRDLASRSPDGLIVQPHTARDADNFQFGLKEFLQEARTLARFNHPNIVRTRSYFEEHDTAYLVMDYVEGVNLNKVLKRQGGRMPEQAAIQLMRGILDGLHAVHAAGFLHRDLKPDNVYVQASGQPVLLDFGAARLALGERSRSYTQILTPGYAPYEQYSRRGGQGPWTDVYGAGATIYRMVTGEVPLEATDRMFGTPLRPAEAFGVSQALSDVLDQAMAIRPEERPQSISAFIAMLEAAVPLPSPSAPTVRSPGRPSQPETPPTQRTIPPPGSLLLRAETACRVVVDGGKALSLEAGQTRTTEVRAGEHLVEATSEDGQHWERQIALEPGTQRVVKIAFDAPQAPPLAAPPPATPRTAARPSFPWRRLGAAGAALLLVGLVGVALIGIFSRNAAPVANDDYLSVGNFLLFSFVQVLDNDTDADGDTMQVVTVSEASQGEVRWWGNDFMMYQKPLNYVGADTLTYTISDGQGGTAQAQIYIDVPELYDSLEAAVQDPQAASLLLDASTLTALPDELTRLSNLQTLTLVAGEDLDFADVATKLKALPRLHTLWLFTAGERPLINAALHLAGDARIKNLALFGSGSVLPPEIGRFSHIKSLIVGFDSLKTLPAELAQLTNLEMFLVSELGGASQLAQELGKLAALPRLRILILNRSGIAPLPGMIGQFTELEHLGLQGNALQTLPSEIGQLTRLKSLDLRGNNLVLLPRALGQLTQLRLLDVSNNPIKTLPSEIGRLTGLEVLNLAGDTLVSLPAEIGQLTRLETLNLSSSQLTTLPAAFGQLARLETLDLRFGRNADVAGMLTVLGPLPALHALTLRSSSPLVLPSEIGQLSGLRTLDVSAFSLTALPAGIGQLTRLETLDVGEENVLSSLPAEISQLVNLNTLNVRFGLNAVLADALAKLATLPDLQTLNIRDDALVILPTGIGQLSALRDLTLRVNRNFDIANAVNKLAALRQLQALSLADNNLGTIPGAIGQLSQLQRLDLSSNELVTLPPEIQQLTQLETLSLCGNAFPAAEQERLRALLPNTEVVFSCGSKDK